MVPIALDPAVSSLLAFCNEQIRTAGPYATQPYAVVRNLIRDSHTTMPELEATLTVLAADYYRRADDLRAKTLNDLADSLVQSAKVFEKLLARLTAAPATLANGETGNAAEVLTAISWLWQELEARFGCEVAEEIHAAYNQQGTRYAQARAQLRLAGRYTHPHYARHRRYPPDESEKETRR